MHEEILIIEDENKNVSEPFIDYLYESFNYEHEENGARSISFTAYKTDENQDVYYYLVNDNYIIYAGQYFVIKNVAIKSDNTSIQADITAEHIMFELQNHYIEKENEEDLTVEVSDDTESETEKVITMTAKEYIENGLKDNKLGYTFEFIGKHDVKKKVDSLGEKNGMEYLTSGAETFGYIYFADNKNIKIYNQKSYGTVNDTVIRYKYNTSNMELTMNSADVKTAIKGYGKKISDKELKNYNDKKTKDMELNGNFIKHGTWRTENIGDSYSYTLDCKWGDETLIWTLKKMSKGGTLDVYLDNKKIGSYDCYSENAKTEKKTLSKNLSKGKHTFKAVFTGKKNGVDYKKSKPCMYIGTEKSVVLKTESKRTPEKTYHVVSEYRSPNFNPKLPKYAPSVYSEDIVDKKELDKELKETLQDKPVIELSVTYNGLEKFQEDSIIRFIHEPTGISDDLRVVSFKKSLDLMNQPLEIGFSNAKTDIIKIQQQIDNNIKLATTPLGYGNSAPIYSSVIGSVLVDE